MGKGEASKNAGTSRKSFLDTLSHLQLGFKLWLLTDFLELGRPQGDASTLRVTCFPQLLRAG